MKVLVVDVSTPEELKDLIEALNQSQETVRAEAISEEPKLEEPKAEVAQPEEPTPEPAAPEEPIEELAISSRLVKVLHEKHIDNIPALTRLRERDLKRIPQIGQASLREIKNALHKKGLRLRRRDYKGAA